MRVCGGNPLHSCSSHALVSYASLSDAPFGSKKCQNFTKISRVIVERLRKVLLGIITYPLLRQHYRLSKTKTFLVVYPLDENKHFANIRNKVSFSISWTMFVYMCIYMVNLEDHEDEVVARRPAACVVSGVGGRGMQLSHQTV